MRAGNARRGEATVVIRWADIRDPRRVEGRMARSRVRRWLRRHPVLPPRLLRPL